MSSSGGGGVIIVGGGGGGGQQGGQAVVHGGSVTEQPLKATRFTAAEVADILDALGDTDLGDKFKAAC